MNYFFHTIQKLLFKINIVRYFAQTLKYKVRIGNLVNFDIKGKINFANNKIVIRDFADVVVYPDGNLDLGENVFIGKSVEIGASNIKIHANTSIQNQCILLGNIEIGRNCIFGPSIYVSSGFHYFKYRPALLIRDQDRMARNAIDLSKDKITIEDDIWIGKNVVIINNVTIGKGAIIAANTFVNKNVDPYTIVAGSPLRVIGKRLNFFEDMPDKIIGNLENHYPYFYKGFDYSNQSMAINGYVSVADTELSFFIKNTQNKKFLVIFFEKVDPLTLFSFNGQIVAINSNNLLKYPLPENYTDKFSCKIEAQYSSILINSIYFDDK